MQFIEAKHKENPKNEYDTLDKINTISICPNGHKNRPLIQKSGDEDYSSSHWGAPDSGGEHGVLSKSVKCSKCKAIYNIEIEIWSS